MKLLPNEKLYDIGGVIELKLVQEGGSYTGEYKRKGSRNVYMFDCTGMSKKQILTTFWDKVKKMQKSS